MASPDPFPRSERRDAGSSSGNYILRYVVLVPCCSQKQEQHRNVKQSCCSSCGKLCPSIRAILATCPGLPWITAILAVLDFVRWLSVTCCLPQVPACRG